MNIVGWVDLTKNGVLAQKDLNKIGAWCERIIDKSPLSDKLDIQS